MYSSIEKLKSQREQLHKKDEQLKKKIAQLSAQMREKERKYAHEASYELGKLLLSKLDCSWKELNWIALNNLLDRFVQEVADPNTYRQNPQDFETAYKSMKDSLSSNNNQPTKD